MIQLPKICIDETSLLDVIKEFDIKLYLFGSVLREDFSEDSDIDVLLVFSKKSKHSLFEIIDLKYKLKNIFKRKVDIIEKDGIKNPYRRKAILSTAKRVYAA